MTLILVLLLALSGREFTPAPSAEDLWRQGVEQDAEFHTDSARKLFMAATRLRPDFLPAHLDYMELMVRSGRHIELRREYDASKATGIGECLSVLAWGRSSHDVPEVRQRYLRLISRYGRTPCSEVAHTVSGDDSVPVAAQLIRQAITLHGSSPAMAKAFSVALFREKRSAEALAYLRTAIDSSSGLNGMRYRGLLVTWLFVAGKEREAIEAIRQMEGQLSRDPRPHLRWVVLEFKRLAAEQKRELVSFFEIFSGFNSAMYALAERNNVPGYAFEARFRDAAENIDKGDYVTAVRRLNDAIRIAESVRSPEFRLRGYLYRGRALVAQGDQPAAIADLRRASQNARLLHERYRLVESFQFLGRAYSSRGQWRDAMAAADSFTLHGRGVRDPSKRMILLHEAGTIYLKAGFHERSRQYFEEMVRTIDRDQLNFEYAGEYLERIGDYSRALRYYRAANEQPMSGARKLALAGLVRVYSDLGFQDSAERSARIHDALPLTPQYEILLPRLLVRSGRRDEAVRLAANWLELQQARGNPMGIAIAHNLLSELNLPRNPRAALDHAAAAERAIASVKSTAELVDAKRYQGLASSRLGDSRRAIQFLQQARALSRSLGDVVVPVTLLSDLGDVAGARDPKAALRWYAQASDALRGVSESLDDPVMLARFRSVRRGLFDSAITMALRLPETASVRAVGEWSSRKKRAGWSAPLLKPAMRRSPTVVDYVVAGDSIVALVYSIGQPRLVRLRMTARRANDLAEQLVRPFTTTSGGNIDIARARFSLDVAAQLYDGLVRPFESLLSREGIIIVPDVPLQRVPFDALVRSRPRGASNTSYVSAEFLADRWAVAYSPDPVTALRRVSPPAIASSPMTLVSQDAPGVAAERTEIISRWENNGVQLLAGPNATETRVRSAAKQPILHFATHGVSDDVDPLRSHLVLRKDVANDGLLHAAEVAGSVRGVKLVFLSACETAGGPSFSGTGSLSLARFFLDAGVNSVIATQWPIAAVGSQIAADFYSGVKAGVDAREALHRAKLKVRRTPATAHPFYWASHIYVGQ